jgi:hypothetical protein
MCYKLETNNGTYRVWDYIQFVRLNYMYKQT